LALVLLSTCASSPLHLDEYLPKSVGVKSCLF